MEIGTQLTARSPLDILEFRGDVVSIPKPMFPVGTKVAYSSKNHKSNYNFFAKAVGKQLFKDTSKVVNKLRKEGYSGGKDAIDSPLPYFNMKQIAAIRRFMKTADSVEIAGHAPVSMQVVSHAANQCYLENGQCHSGVSFNAYLLFRKTVKGQDLVYIHAHAICPETSLIAV